MFSLVAPLPSREVIKVERKGEESYSLREINHFCGNQGPFQTAVWGWTDGNYITTATT